MSELGELAWSDSFQALQGRLASLASVPTLREGMFLFVASTGGSALNYLYHFAVGRMLGPADYAALLSLIALLTTVAAPFGVSQTIVADASARLLAGAASSRAEPSRSQEGPGLTDGSLRQEAQGLTNGSLGRVKDLLIRFLRGLLAVAVLATAGLALAQKPVAGFLHLSSSLPVLVLALALVPMVTVPAVNGVVQGLQDFRGMSLAGLLGGAGRLVGGAGLVMLGFGVSGAVAGFAVAGWASAMLLVGLLWRVWRAPAEPSDVSIGQLSRYGLQVSLATVALAILTNTDVLLARHFFPSEQAGYYAAAATLGKVVFFLPGPISVLLFPKVSSRHASGAPSADIFRKAALAVAAMSFAVTGVMWLWPHGVVRLLYGSAFSSTASLVGTYGLAMTGYALVMLSMAYYLALHEWRYIVLMLSFGGLQALALGTLSLGPEGYIVVLGLCAWGLVIVAELWLGGLQVWRRVRAIG